MWAPSKTRGAFDFEAWKWINPRCCGLRWGDKDAREWRFIVDEKSKWPASVAPRVLRTMLAVAESGGPWEWWAHNGGKYDDCFLLEACTRMGWEVEGHVAAGRLITMSMRAPGATQALKLYDSMALLPSSLKEVAKDFQLTAKKLLGDDDYSIDVRRWSLNRLESGCLADCEVVLQALERVETMLEEWGGGIRATFSAAALSVLESQTKDLPNLLKNKLQNIIARKAYCGGRVEVFHHSPRGPISEWDVNSSYPWSMTQRLPYRLLGSTFSKRDLTMMLKGERLSGVIYAKVKVPVCHVPPLPFSPPETGGVYFPTGEWEAWFSAPELSYALELGCEVTPLEGVKYTAEKPFEKFVSTLYEVKRSATGAKKSFAKFLLNGCYGKFGQRPERENLKIFGDEIEALEWAFSKPSDTVRPLSRVDERFWSEATEKWARRTHYALAAAVTAHSRILLHRALKASTGLAYCDTDSVHAREWHGEAGAALGQLKLEHRNCYGRYYAPKIYSLKLTNPVKDKDGKPKYEQFCCKGFPVSKSDFQKVVRSHDKKRQPVRAEKMRLAKSLLRHGAELAWEEIEKRWAGYSAKRSPESDGSTRPWDVKEILSGAHLQVRSPLAR